MANSEKVIKWAFLVSGWGKTAVNAIELFVQKSFERSEIALLIYDEEPCGAMEKAKLEGVKAVRISRKEFETHKEHQRKIIIELQNNNIDSVFLLAYKFLIKEEMLLAFKNKIFNIHPSLFPSFLGTQTAIQDALDYGVKISGITVHIIDDELDRGLIVVQEPIRILNEDVFDTLYPKYEKAGIKLIEETIKLNESSNLFNV